MAQKVKTAVLLSAVIAAAAAGSGGAAASEQRGYEMVSPADKTASVLNGSFSNDVHVSDSGESVFYPSTTPLPESATGLVGYYRADRGLAAWATTPLVPVDPARAGSGGQSMTHVWDVSPSGSSVLYETRQSFDPADTVMTPNGGGGLDLYVQRRDGAYTWISRNTADPTRWDNRILSATVSADDSHVVFETPFALLPADSARDTSLPDQRGLYDWHDGVLELVATDTSGNLLSTGNAALGDSYHTDFEIPMTGINPVSTDGSRIFFTIDSGAYVRDHGVVHTIAPGSTPSGFQRFEGATPDGSTAYVVSDEQLTPDDTDNSPDLYAYDVSSQTLHRISKGASDAAAGAGVADRGVRVSDDGRIVYFLTAGGLGGDPAAPAGKLNLYVSVDGAIRHVANVAAGDLNKGPVDTLASGNPLMSDWFTTPDGQHLAFATSTAVTNDDLDANVDIFEFDLGSGHIARVSRGDAAGNDSVDALLGLNPDETTFPQWNGREAHVMSDDGRYIVFQTEEALSNRDINGLRDVYVHDESDGTTQLVSGGSDDVSSDFLGMGRSGRDVIFATFQALVPQDQDRFKDIYDARVGGGYPAPPAASPVCRDDDCQGPASGVPSDIGAPGSATLHETSSGASAAAPAAKTKIVLVRPTSAALQRAARTGSLTLTVRVNRAGTLRLLAKARLGAHTSTVARRTVIVRRAGTLHVTLQLSAASRRALARAGRLGVGLEASLPPGHSAKRLTVTLRRPGKSSTVRSTGN